MTQHDPAMKAAIRLYWFWLGKPTLGYDHLTKESRDVVKQYAAIITEEMALELPALRTRNAALREALEGLINHGLRNLHDYDESQAYQTAQDALSDDTQQKGKEERHDS